MKKAVWINVQIDDEVLALLSLEGPETCGGQTSCNGGCCGSRD